MNHVGCKKDNIQDSNNGSDTPNSKEYVDLGLLSGTQWNATNEPSYYTWDDAVIKFARNLPTETQFIGLLRLYGYTIQTSRDAVTSTQPKCKWESIFAASGDMCGL